MECAPALAHLLLICLAVLAMLDVLAAASSGYRVAAMSSLGSALHDMVLMLFGEGSMRGDVLLPRGTTLTMPERVMLCGLLFAAHALLVYVLMSFFVAIIGFVFVEVKARRWAKGRAILDELGHDVAPELAAAARRLLTRCCHWRRSEDGFDAAAGQPLRLPAQPSAHELLQLLQRVCPGGLPMPAAAGPASGLPLQRAVRVGNEWLGEAELCSLLQRALATQASMQPVKASAAACSPDAAPEVAAALARRLVQALGEPLALSSTLYQQQCGSGVNDGSDSLIAAVHVHAAGADSDSDQDDAELAQYQHLYGLLSQTAESIERLNDNMRRWQLKVGVETNAWLATNDELLAALVAGSQGAISSHYEAPGGTHQPIQQPHSPLMGSASSMGGGAAAGPGAAVHYSPFMAPAAQQGAYMTDGSADGALVGAAAPAAPAVPAAAAPVPASRASWAWRWPTLGRSRNGQGPDLAAASTGSSSTLSLGGVSLHWQGSRLRGSINRVAPALEGSSLSEPALGSPHDSEYVPLRQASSQQPVMQLYSDSPQAGGGATAHEHGALPAVGAEAPSVSATLQAAFVRAHAGAHHAASGGSPLSTPSLPNGGHAAPPTSTPPQARSPSGIGREGVRCIGGAAGGSLGPISPAGAGGPINSGPSSPGAGLRGPSPAPRALDGTVSIRGSRRLQPGSPASRRSA